MTDFELEERRNLEKINHASRLKASSLEAEGSGVYLKALHWLPAALPCRVYLCI